MTNTNQTAPVTAKRFLLVADWSRAMGVPMAAWNSCTPAERTALRKAAAVPNLLRALKADKKSGALNVVEIGLALGAMLAADSFFDTMPVGASICASSSGASIFRIA